MPGDFNPKLRCAHAIDRDRFALVYGELEYDDTFSIMLFHDGAFETPWRRIDVAREINAVTSFGPAVAGARGEAYALLSNEGDVYFSDPGFPAEKIAGAGIQSPDASGRGALYALAAHGDTLFAAGTNGQVYRRGRDGVWIAWGDGQSGEEAIAQVALAAIQAFGPQVLMVVGGVLPEAQAYDVTEDPTFFDDMSIDDLAALFERQLALEASTLEASGKAFRMGDGGVLSLVPAPVPNLRALCVETADSIWIVGENGAILHGGLERPFEIVSSAADQQTLLSVTRFRGETIVASEDGLHRFDGHRLQPLQRRLGEVVDSGVPSPLKVQAVGDFLFYFDAKHGVRLWDGDSWEAVRVPPELLRREFRDPS
ncbi:hypothetical protein [Aureimonas jatrophae]|uniref:Uncharacterized protein n=1 Tax=Aureimonas jatrophae TaxID=1166073 RepID=A0A1H0N5I4_9HYPH|nr:hypothetical protein [Aureimonas jatrophae]MBB3953044.1 hypothetical protein [Aureimonas jatrophae]SDO87756.1 hypothetical protein SAMN05192530_11735 [Aureimonas jatrophae]